MATAAQIEANRRNAQKSTGPRTQAGKNRSRINGLDHGCRANILVLPTEDPNELEERSRGWHLSLKPRNPAEEFLVDRLVNLSWQSERIKRAHTARLTRRIYHTTLEEADREEQDVIELGQKLFRDACGPRALHLQQATAEPIQDGDTRRISDYSIDEDHPMRLVQRLRTTETGCQWLLDQWASLRDLLEKGVPWLSSDKLKAVRLLGRHPIDAVDSGDVARVYLASHVLMNQGGQPFQEILNELAPHEVPAYDNYLRLRCYHDLAPEDADAARLMLMGMIDRTTEKLEDKAGVLRDLAEIHARTATDRLSWDDTAEGERLRRYELTCKRTWHRSFDLLMKIRSTRGELDFGTIASLGRSAATRTVGTFNIPAPFVMTDMTELDEPVDELDPHGEANFERENAPTEPNFGVPAPSVERHDLAEARKTVEAQTSTPAESVNEPVSSREANSAGDNAPNEVSGQVPSAAGAGRAVRKHPKHNRGAGLRHGGGPITSQHSAHQEIERQVGSRSKPLLNVSAIG